MDKEKYEIQKIQFVHNLSLARLYDQYFDYLAKKDDLENRAEDRTRNEDQEYFS